MPHYKLTHEAQADIDRIFDYGIETFGVNQAIDYLQGLKDRLDQIAHHPLMYPAVNHIRPGYRRSVYGVHAIFFRAQPNFVEMMRLIHCEAFN